MSALKTFLANHRFVVSFATLGAVLLAALVEVAAVFSAGMTDWYMHLLMWLLLLTWFLLTTWSAASGRRIRSWLNVVIVDALALFWMWILSTRVGAEKVVVDGNLTLREPLYILWLPIILLGLAALALPLIAFGARSVHQEKGE
jgi:hypothetical protein